MKVPVSSALRFGILSCHSCRLPVETPACAAGKRPLCPRCHAPLHPRKENSLNRTLALLLAAAILYAPANLLPVMVTTTLGDVQTDTILSGVLHFMATGSWGIAAIIFVASVCVPLLKILVLALLLLSVRGRWRWRPAERVRLYRMVDFVGRWSMVDVFAVTLMVSVVKLDVVADVAPGPGIVYFAAVVVLTMLASSAFDPRLIIDAAEETDD